MDFINLPELPKCYGNDMDDLLWFWSPPRELWDDLLVAVCQDEEPDLEPAENVLDDLILFEVGYEGSE